MSQKNRAETKLEAGLKEAGSEDKNHTSHFREALVSNELMQW